MALVLVLVVVIVVEAPLAHVWYSQRQQHLTSTFGQPHPVHLGDPVAVLQIPAQGINVTVVQGVGPGLLRSGPGHRPSTPVPGQQGNCVIFGHESAWGGPFEKLGKLSVGDNVFVQPRTANGPGQVYFYRVSSTRVVPDSDRRPYASSDDFRMTLVTANPGGGRRVVVATSGSAGRLAPPASSATTGTGAVAPANTWPLVGVGASVVGILAIRLVRRRQLGTSLLVAALPIVLLGLLSLTLLGDALLRSPLS